VLYACILIFLKDKPCLLIAEHIEMFLAIIAGTRRDAVVPIGDRPFFHLLLTLKPTSSAKNIRV
jgi:hypothetical protein